MSLTFYFIVIVRQLLQCYDHSIIFGILWLKCEDLATDKTRSLPSFLSFFWSLLYILQVSDFRQSTRPLCVLSCKGNFVF